MSKQQMDKLEFKIQNKINDSYEIQAVTILVNGQNLIDLLKVYELPFAKKEGSEDIAGGYDGLTPEKLLNHLTDPDEIDIDENNKVSILECKCRCDGCWPMQIKVVELADKIIWTDFEQPHRTIDHHCFWDYTKFGEFSFDTQNYKEQLDILRLAKTDKAI